MRLAQFSKGSLLFIAGGLCGWWLAHFTLSANKNPVPTAVSISPTLDSKPSGSTQTGIVWLNVERADGSTLIPGIVLNRSNIIIASLAAAYPSNRVYLMPPGQETPEFLSVVSASSASELVAFEFESELTSPYRLSDDDGTLFIGRSINYLSPDRVIQGEVDSSLQQDNRGRERFAVKLNATARQPTGPIIEPSSRNVIGFSSRCWSRWMVARSA